MAFETVLLADHPHTFKTHCLAVLVAEGALPASLFKVDEAADGSLSRVYAVGDFKGKKDEAVVLYTRAPAQRVLLVGLGPKEGLSASQVRAAAALAAKRMRGLAVPRAAIYVAEEVRSTLGSVAVGQALAEGAAYGAWEFTDLKRPPPPKDKKPELRRVDLLAPRATTSMERGHRIGVAIGAGQWFARDLQALPSNLCTPSHLAKVARELGRRRRLKVTVLDRAAIEKEGMRALLAVAQGSAQDPRFIVVEYRAAGRRTGRAGKPVVLIGKGVTFDTGGISLKPSANMEEMKYDMSGAAAVLGTMDAIGKIRPKVNVVGLVPATENMPSGTAIKPGDVIRSHFDKTIEIINTDAEGRLILSDALSYARRFKPACAVDIATLTGAVVVALGEEAMGLLGNDESLIDAVRTAGQRAGEPAWPLPLWEGYGELLKSTIADVKNSGGRSAGTITAAWFLSEFVDGFPWAHLDIAGTAYSDRETPSRIKGPTGSGVRILSDFVLSRKR